MRSWKCLALAGVASLFPLSVVRAQQEVRVATYNIKFLNAGIAPERVTRLKQVLERLDADVIALQEIKDRPALEKIFPPQDWLLVIDNESGDDQDVAVAVRKPLKVVGLNTDPNDLDADDDDFLFPNDTTAGGIAPFFPNNRDVLKVQVEVPDANGARFFVFVVHAKARSQNNRPARNVTEPRRVGHAERLMKVLEQQFDEADFIVLGDFNDNPDDRSLNILETGDPNAIASKEEVPGPFLINLCEPLVELGHVSHGRTASDIQGGTINTIDPLSRTRNFDAIGTNIHTGDILFDQLLVPVQTANRHVAGSTKVFDDPLAVQGPPIARASDHLPVFADFSFGDDHAPDPDPAAGVRIAALMANPEGADEGRESVTLQNTTAAAVPLAGWTLRDRAGHQFALSGNVGPNMTRRIVLPAHSMPLNNGGDDVALIDDQGQVRSRVTYAANQARSGQEATFP